MEEIAEIVREIGRQQSENAYYRTCFHLLKRLQDLTERSAGKLSHLYQLNNETGRYTSSCVLYTSQQVAGEMQTEVDTLKQYEEKARLELAELYSL